MLARFFRNRVGVLVVLFVLVALTFLYFLFSGSLTTRCQSCEVPPQDCRDLVCPTRTCAPCPTFTPSAPVVWVPSTEPTVLPTPTEPTPVPPSDCSFLHVSPETSKRLDSSTKAERLLVLVGNRAELVKLSPILHSLDSKSITAFLVFSGEDTDLTLSYASDLQLTPDLTLDVGSAGPSLITSLFSSLSCVFDLFQSSVVLILGDSSTSDVASQLSFSHHVPLAHVESGLRTKNLDWSYPEEANRKLLGTMCRWCFPPAALAASRSSEKGAVNEFILGNPVVDAVNDVFVTECKDSKNSVDVPEQPRTPSGNEVSSLPSVPLPFDSLSASDETIVVVMDGLSGVISLTPVIAELSRGSVPLLLLVVGETNDELASLQSTLGFLFEAQNGAPLSSATCWLLYPDHTTSLFSTIHPHVKIHSILVSTGPRGVSSLFALSSAPYNIPITFIETELASNKHSASLGSQRDTRVIGSLCNLCFTSSVYDKHRMLERGVMSSRVAFEGSVIADSSSLVSGRLESDETDSVILNRLKDEMDAVLKARDSKANKNTHLVLVMPDLDPYAFVDEFKQLLDWVWGRVDEEQGKKKVMFVVVLSPEMRQEKKNYPELQKERRNEDSYFEISFWKEGEVPTYQELLGIMKLLSPDLYLTPSLSLHHHVAALSLPSTPILVPITDPSVIYPTTPSYTLRLVPKKSLLEKMMESLSRAPRSLPQLRTGKAGTGERISKRILENKFPSLTFQLQPDRAITLEVDPSIQFEEPDTVAVILGLYKRNYTIPEVMEALRRQTHRPTEIWFVQNGEFLDTEYLKNAYPDVNIATSTENLYFHFRHAIPLMVRSEYVFVLDDDVVIPDETIEVFLRTCKQRHALVGIAGRRVHLDYKVRMKAGKFPYDPYEEGEKNDDREVDFSVNGYFIRKEWLTTMWSELPPTFQVGDDISLAAILQIRGGIPTYVPQRPGGWKLKNFGADRYASFAKKNHLQFRGPLIEYWHRRGWSLWRERNQG